MHRSGTSYLSRVFQESGIMMGEDQSENAESHFFQRINHSLNKASGFSWHQPGIPTDWNVPLNESSFFLDFLRSRRKPWNFIRFATGGKWGFKDPRNTFTLEFWLENYFPNAKVIHIYRNGLDVAISLMKRNALNRSQGYQKGIYGELDEMSSCLDLWEKYVSQSFSIMERMENRGLTLCFEKMISGDTDTLEQLAAFTGCSQVADKLLATADSNRTSRFDTPTYRAEALELSSSSAWMQELGYTV